MDVGPRRSFSNGSQRLTRVRTWHPTEFSPLPILSPPFTRIALERQKVLRAGAALRTASSKSAMAFCRNATNIVRSVTK